MGEVEEEKKEEEKPEGELHISWNIYNGRFSERI